MKLLLFSILCAIISANPWAPMNELYINPTLSDNIQNTIHKIEDGKLYADGTTISNMISIT